MNLRYLFFIILLFITCTAFSQGNDFIPGKNFYSYWAAKLPIANMLDINSPNFLVGVERRFDKHNAVQLLAGPSIDAPENKENGGAHNVFNGFRLRTEYRRYFKVKPYNAFFLAGELFYTKYNSAARSSFTDTFTSWSYTENYTVHKNNYGVNIKFGFHKSFRYRKDFMRRIAFDAYGGVGIKHRQVTHTGRSNPLDILFPSRHPNFYNISYHEGNENVASMTLNFMIAYIFHN